MYAQAAQTPVSHRSQRRRRVRLAARAHPIVSASPPPPGHLHTFDALFPPMFVGSMSRQSKLLRAQFLSTVVRVFTLIDGIFLLFWAFFYWPLFFPLILVIAGFYGARYYRWELVMLYLLFLCAQFALRVWFLVEGVDNRTFFIIVTAIGCVIELYIILLVASFIQTLWTLSEEDAYLLRHHDSTWWASDTTSGLLVHRHPHSEPVMYYPPVPLSHYYQYGHFMHGFGTTPPPPPLATAYAYQVPIGFSAPPHQHQHTPPQTPPSTPPAMQQSSAGARAADTQSDQTNMRSFMRA